MARTLMLQGTGSDVGKSLLVAGLCRCARRQGLRVLPFKPQNMSNNAAVTQEGGEIGRAQALQAKAAGVAPSVHMNPVLLKPQSETGAQVVVQGRVRATAVARRYPELRRELLQAVGESFEELRSQCDLVLVEGAGSPAEVNLRHYDIANMGFALPWKVPVVLVGDIDRGGVIAAVVGTHTVLEPEERELIRGYVINKFRGDVTLFEDGLRIISERTSWPSFGVLPMLECVSRLPAEDAVPLEAGRASSSHAALRVAVPMLARIANFDDLDPLSSDELIQVDMVPRGQPLPLCDVVVLPGTKATRADLDFLREQGWDTDVLAHVRRGGRVLGLCGGYQMLGQQVHDPLGLEGPPGSTAGLGLLDVTTTLEPHKTLGNVTGRDARWSQPLEGYEIHLGTTAGPDCARPFAQLADGRADGARSADERVAGTYLHGVFVSDPFRRAWLRAQGIDSRLAHDHSVETALDALADALEEHLDVSGLLALAT